MSDLTRKTDQGCPDDGFSSPNFKRKAAHKLPPSYTVAAKPRPIIDPSPPEPGTVLYAAWAEFCRIRIAAFYKMKTEQQKAVEQAQGSDYKRPDDTDTSL